MIPVKKISKDVYLVNGIKTVIIGHRTYSTDGLSDSEFKALNNFRSGENNPVKKDEPKPPDELSTGKSQSTIHRDGTKEVKQ